jgi:lipopolysaccharide/colanic/teichoic acid biosynthesis glycosyltransferase/2-keto-3-deoxy-L-rhamnonate aldolase RhmA
MDYKDIKRCLDIICSVLGLIILMPLFVIVALLIKLESKGPVIYKQLRLGLHGREFTMYKFRTMYSGAEKEGVYNLKDDHRVSRIGRILRLTSIDELPQLLNILRGEMSFIGPRPPLTYHPWTFSEYKIPQKKRFMVLPGITGLAQIHGRKDLDWDKRIEYDIEYVDKLSLTLDLKILLISILKVISMDNNLNVCETVKKERNYPYLRLMYATNDTRIAKVAEESGVDWIMIDLEIIGKVERQGHLNTLISYHKLEDIKKIKESITKAKIIVRINPMYHGSKDEINRAIEDGADIIMLPFFKTKKEVEDFIHYVNGRVKTCLLFETPEAIENIDKILSIPGIDYAHVGINDLHIGYKRVFMFSLVADGTVEAICKKFREKGIPYGFGGIARLGHGLLPAEYIIGEMYRQGSSMAIVSRSFCKVSGKDNYEIIEKVFNNGVRNIRSFEEHIRKKDYRYFLKNQRILQRKVAEIEENLIKGREGA